MNPVHVAILRRVRPGSEAEFERRILDFIHRTMALDGILGAHLLLPLPGDPDPSYGILRSFRDEAARAAFYRSPVYLAWEDEIAPYVLGPAQLRDLHGLEAFFRNPGAAPPPRWKMAVVTWMGVFPTALFWSKLLPPLLAPLPAVLASALFNVAVVATLAWAVMPWLTRHVMRRWLHG